VTISLIFKLGFSLVPQFRRNRSESRANVEGKIFARCRARINGAVKLLFSRRRLIVLKGFSSLKPLKSYTTGLVASISFAPKVRSGRKLLAGAIVDRENNRNRTQMRQLSLRCRRVG
jgi:hypothetical protein